MPKDQTLAIKIRKTRHQADFVKTLVNLPEQPKHCSNLPAT